jgi:hypothetical protein
LSTASGVEVYDGEELRTTNTDKAQYITRITYDYTTDDVAA